MHTYQILIHHIHFNPPSGKALFKDLSLVFSQAKYGLVGRNGCGKSSLLRLIVGEFQLSSGSIQRSGKIAYVPQNFAPRSETTVAEVLEAEQKLKALYNIESGSIDEADFNALNEDWQIRERLNAQLGVFGLEALPLDRSVKDLSGGEITRLQLCKAFASDADFLLLDEPTNHLDQSGRQQLYQALEAWSRGLLIASHDRSLLNKMDAIIELNTLGAFSYGGNYATYIEQKKLEQAAQIQQLQDAKKHFQARQTSIQASREKHEQKQSYGRELKNSGGIDKLSANAAKGRSENSQSKLRMKAEKELAQAQTQLEQAREKIEIHQELQFELAATRVPQGKMVLNMEEVRFSYPGTRDPLIQDFNLHIQGPERLALAGNNGCGKTTLVKLILGDLQAQQGQIELGINYLSYLDQKASLLNPELSLLDNFLKLNPQAKINEAYRNLASFAFRNTQALKLVKELSGGEKLRALLACVLLSPQAPQLLILDEPTNHLDIHSLEVIEAALKKYQGAILVISHDPQFLANIGVGRVIRL